MRQVIIRFLFVCAAAFTFTRPAAQTEANNIATEQLTKQRRVLKFEAGRLSGAGATFLLNEAKAAQFFLIGEDHGIAEMPELTAALFQDIYPFGYRRLAVEAGPITARQLTKLAAAPDAAAAFGAFNRENPFALPFFYWREEAAMLATVMKTTKGANDTFWGLDQEFVVSPKLHFKRLVEIAPDKQAKDVAGGYYEQTRTEVERMIKAKNPSLNFFAAAKDEDFKRLNDAFKPKPGSEAAEILAELKVSWEIYAQIFSGRGYESNAQRSQLMKTHFTRYYRAALSREKTPPKALFKFGANHVRKGRNYTNVYDLGNFTAELAAFNGLPSFHLLVVGASGTQNGYLPFLGNDADRKKPINVAEAFSFFDAKPLVAAAGDGWSVLDLRPLRPLLHGGKLGPLPKGLADLIWGFDAVLVIRQVRAATLFE